MGHTCRAHRRRRYTFSEEEKNCVALGWAEMGDLSKLQLTREAFKAGYVQAFPDSKQGLVRVASGQLYRFVHEMKDGDVVIYPSPRDRQIHIRKVEGPPQFKPSIGGGYTNQRPVKWLKALPRSSFSQEALYEVGAAMSFFQVKNYA